jgi:hypothetical protein
MKGRSVLLFFSLVMAALMIISELFPQSGISLGSIYLRFTSLHSLVENRKVNEAEPPPVDTVEMHKMQLTDSIAYYKHLVDSSDLRFWLPSPQYFDSFWQAVENAREQGRTVRILHYGDSQVEMDHISSRLRAYMQNQFGGGGPGMLPFQTTTPTFFIRQSNNGDLTHLASFGDSLAVRSRGDYGPMMQSFRLGDEEATVTIKASTNSHVDKRVKQFSRVKLISNNRSPLNISFTDLKNKKVGSTSTSATNGITAVDFQTDSAFTTAFRMQVRGNSDLYCLLVDDSCGVAVDNIPMRGCSGQQFTLVKESLLTSAYSQMDIELIIMQFGGNSVPYLKTSEAISTYCTSIGRQIDHLHACCPKAKILFVGPSDMSHRVKGELQTYNIIPELIDSLAATAVRHNAAYWSIYHAMGGWNSMPQWSRQGLAGKDYIHFSQKGADQMGDMMSQAFDNSHVLYQLEQRWEAQKPKHVPPTKKAKKTKSGKRKKGGRR